MYILPHDSHFLLGSRCAGVQGCGSKCSSFKHQSVNPKFCRSHWPGLTTVGNFLMPLLGIYSSQALTKKPPTKHPKHSNPKSFQITVNRQRPNGFRVSGKFQTRNPEPETVHRQDQHLCLRLALDRKSPILNPQHAYASHVQPTLVFKHSLVLCPDIATPQYTRKETYIVCFKTVKGALSASFHGYSTNSLRRTCPAPLSTPNQGTRDDNPDNYKCLRLPRLI